MDSRLQRVEAEESQTCQTKLARLAFTYFGTLPFSTVSIFILSPFPFHQIPSPVIPPLVSMADLYPPAHSRSPQQYQYPRHTDSQQSPTYPTTNNSNQMVPYPPQLMSSQHSNSSNASSDENHNEPPSPSKSNSEHQPPKTESKPQATFLTKLYSYVLYLCHSPSSPDVVYVKSA